MPHWQVPGPQRADLVGRVYCLLSWIVPGSTRPNCMWVMRHRNLPKHIWRRLLRVLRVLHRGHIFHRDIHALLRQLHAVQAGPVPTHAARSFLGCLSFLFIWDISNRPGCNQHQRMHVVWDGHLPNRNRHNLVFPVSAVRLWHLAAYTGSKQPPGMPKLLPGALSTSIRRVRLRPVRKRDLPALLRRHPVPLVRCGVLYVLVGSVRVCGLRRWAVSNRLGAFDLFVLRCWAFSDWGRGC